jgi:methylenetetrahydrofolate reductase (NADPH)
VDDLSSLQVDKPVLPGIMPVTSLSSIPRMAQMGAALPQWAIDRLEDAGRQGPENVRKVGIDMATELCARLLDAGAPGLHFYTLNRSNATREIYSSLGLASS